MRSAAARRFVILAALVLLLPVWVRPSSATAAGRSPAAAVAAVAAMASTPGPAATGDSTAPPAIRGRSVVGGVLYGTRVDRGRGPVAVALVALLLLLGAVPWSRLQVRPAWSALGRRRYAIALRAPPLPSCA